MQVQGIVLPENEAPHGPDHEPEVSIVAQEPGEGSTDHAHIAALPAVLPVVGQARVALFGHLYRHVVFEAEAPDAKNGEFVALVFAVEGQVEREILKIVGDALPDEVETHLVEQP